MVLMTVVTGVLIFLLVVTLTMSYLIYVRIKHLQREIERMRSKMEIRDDELENIESSLNSVDM
ncbi:MAG: hypothetical protein U5J64_12160 [Halobacteriales archaeon]|nr:hypothetical protein [Halobacteriales archaeon]